MSAANPAPWFILGPGAMGTALAYRLASVGVDARLLHHGEAGERQLREGGTVHRLPFASLDDAEAGSIERLLLATKAIHVEAAMVAALPRLANGAVAVTIANGLGFARRYQRPEGDLCLHRAVSTAAAYRDGEGRVVVAATGETHVGIDGYAGERPAWFADSLAGLASWAWAPDIEACVAAKFAVNCIINPLTATLDCRNGELLTASPATRELRALCDETEPALVRLGLWPKGRSLYDAVAAVCRATAANRSSMLQDRSAGRPTEVEFLTGELLRRAAETGLALPRNAALYEAVTAPG